MRCIKRIGAVVVLLCLCLSEIFFSYASNADNNKKDVIRVGFPIQKGLTYIDENGNYTGYTVDYLKQLSLYTGWEYEFVQVDGDLNTQLFTLFNMLQNGEIDMMGAMNYSKGLSELYLYPDKSYGVAYTTLAVNKDSLEWIENDFSNWNGIRVGTYYGFDNRMEYLEQYAKVNGFTFEEVRYETYGDILTALDNEEIDATIQVDISMSSGLRGIARFEPKDYYFAVSKQKPELLYELNSALEAISQSYPNLQSELYEKHFAFDEEFYISDENKQYIKNLGKIDVLFFDGNAPFQYVEDGEVKGIASTYFKQFSKETGLKYNEVVAYTYDEALELIESDKVDVIACLATNSKLMMLDNVMLSAPYFNSSVVAVSNVLADSETCKEIQGATINTENVMKKLRNRTTEKIFLDSYSVNHYMRKKAIYDGLEVDLSTANDISYSVAVTDNIDGDLIKIFSQYSRSLSYNTRQNMLYTNSSTQPSYSFAELFYIYRYYIIFCVCILVLVICSAVLYAKNKKTRKIQDQMFKHMSKLFGECIFEYFYKNDTLRIQNSKEFFEFKENITGFVKSYKQDDENNDNEYKKVYKELKMMLEKRITKLDIHIIYNGKPCWHRISIKYVNDEANYAIGRITDVDEDIKLKLELETKASHDKLTGLLNRIGLEDYLENYFNDKTKKGVMLLFDIDNFKTVNDTFGHIEGDKLLKNFADSLERFFRDNDLKIRLGGDEFMVFIPNYIPPVTLEEKLDEFIKLLRNNVFNEYKSCNVSVSIGAAYVNKSNSTYRNIYRAADEAMYNAKNSGKDGFFISK